MDGGGTIDGARIGPNAILQLVPVLDAAIGERARRGLFVEAGVPLPPPDAGMLPETQVIRLFSATQFWLPSLAPSLFRQAGLATGDYILANRIPALAKKLIRLMPAPIGASVLAKAIAKHAWTFAGSGRFEVERSRPLTFAIHGNPLAIGPAAGPRCYWHVAVFERLFSALVWAETEVTEATGADADPGICRFRIARKL